MRCLGSFALLAGLVTWALAAPSLAGTLTFSDVVSIQPSIAEGNGFDCGTPGHDPCIDPDWLDATVEFTVDNLADQVTIVLTNQTGQGGDPTFDINQLYFSVSDAVTSLARISVTHNVEGALVDPNSWTLSSSTGDGGPTQADGFGVHDYSLKDGMGNSIALVGPGEVLTIVLGFTSTGDLTQDDFIQLSQQTLGGDNILTYGALKFVNADPSVFTYMDNDSGFGGVVPEPATAAMVALGLIGLGYAGRRRHKA